MRIYILGKMDEEILSDETIKKFKIVEELLEKKGFDVVNPTGKIYQNVLKNILKSEEKGHQIFNDEFDRKATALIYALSILHGCDAVYVLKDWEESPNATAKYYCAKAFGMDIVFEK